MRSEVFDLKVEVIALVDMNFFHIFSTLSLIFLIVIHQIDAQFDAIGKSLPPWDQVKGCTTVSRSGGRGNCFWAGEGKIETQLFLLKSTRSDCVNYFLQFSLIKSCSYTYVKR